LISVNITVDLWHQLCFISRFKCNFTTIDVVLQSKWRTVTEDGGWVGHLVRAKKPNLLKKVKKCIFFIFFGFLAITPPINVPLKSLQNHKITNNV